jgi:hypothetical protein
MKRGFTDLLSATEIGEAEGRAVWKLEKPLDFILDEKRMIHIPPGFETDLASVPRLPIIYGIWGDRAHRASVMHDYLYRIGSVVVGPGSKLTGASKEDADWYFRLAMISTGEPYYIYQPMYLAVRIGGGSSFHRMKVADHFPVDKKE